MKIYRVGGYVRDRLLGIRASDCDYVVIGSTPSEMKSLGYIQVGKSFPVFLHPKTKEEYALARKEKKTGLSHNEFAVDFAPEITLEEDLFRRDLTINAIAEDITTGELIDPFGGIQDIKQQIIRHVSAAFIEDPLRILRVARFAAKLNFSVAPATIKLMSEMTELQDIKTISRERIINELDKALDCPFSQHFFTTLIDCKALSIFFPTLALISQTKIWNIYLEQITTVNSKIDKYVLLGMLYIENGYQHNLNELTLSKQIIRSIQHIALLNNFALDNSAEQILSLFKKLNLWRNQSGFIDLLQLFNSYLVNTQQPTDIITTINKLAIQLLKINITPLIEQFAGIDLISKINQLQIDAINKFKGLTHD